MRIIIILDNSQSRGNLTGTNFSWGPGHVPRPTSMGMLCMHVCFTHTQHPSTCHIDCLGASTRSSLVTPLVTPFKILQMLYEVGLKRIVNLLSRYPDTNTSQISYTTDSDIIKFVF